MWLAVCDDIVWARSCICGCCEAVLGERPGGRSAPKIEEKAASL